MKNAKQEICLCLKISVIGIIVFLFVQFHLYKKMVLYEILIELFSEEFLADLKSFVVIIFSGIFVSAFLALIISIKNYKNQKNRILGEFYIRSLTILNEIFKIRFLEFDRSIDEVLEIIDEEQENDNFKDYNSEIIEITRKMSKKKSLS